MTVPDHGATQSTRLASGQVRTELEDAKDTFQPAWERLYEAFRVTVFDILAAAAVPRAARVSRVLATCSPAR